MAWQDAEWVKGGGGIQKQGGKRINELFCIFCLLRLFRLQDILF